MDDRRWVKLDYSSSMVFFRLAAASKRACINCDYFDSYCTPSLFLNSNESENEINDIITSYPKRVSFDGICRRYPPKPSLQPIVKWHDRCGEFKDKCDYESSSADEIMR